MDNIIVLKFGGSTIDTLSEDFYKNLQKLQNVGLKPIIVHGGGPAIKKMLDEQHIYAEFVDGLRKTTAQAMDVVEMVLSGSVNSAITRTLNASGIRAIGLSGSDDQLLQAKAKNLLKYGYVGDVDKVNVSLLYELVNIGVVPVIAPVGIGEDGRRYNINADTAAGAVAKAVSAKQLVFVTDVPGIMEENRLLETVTEKKIESLISSGTIYGGMIPKVQAALKGLSGNLDEVMIVDGNQSVLKRKETKLIGTVIKRSMEVKEHVSTLSNV